MNTNIEFIFSCHVNTFAHKTYLLKTKAINSRTFQKYKYHIRCNERLAIVVVERVERVASHQSFGILNKECRALK